MRGITILLAAFTMLAPVTHGQQPQDVGQWEPVLDWTSQVQPQCPDKGEFSHAALLPKGSYAGMVLLWKLEFGSPPECTILQTTATWLFNPTNPSQLIRILPNGGAPFDRSIFCSGASWDPMGNLLVVGGVSPT